MITPGDFYWDCNGHPVLCTENDGDAVSGISLFDGTWPRSCSLKSCGPEKLTLGDVIKLREEKGIPTGWGK